MFKTSPEVIVIPFEMEGKRFYHNIVTLLVDGVRDEYIGSPEYLNGHSIATQVYQESLRQMFDFVDADFSTFQRNLVMIGPKLSNFISADRLFTGEKRTNFVTLFSSVAIDLWFTLRNLGLFNLDVPYYLDNPAQDHLVLRALY